MEDIKEHRNTTSSEQHASGAQESERTERSLRSDLEIPRAEWASFLDSFSRQHEGWLASISVTADNNSFAVSNCRVERIYVPQADDKAQIRISMLCHDGERVTHEVNSPLRLTFMRDASGAHEGLNIVSRDGSVVTLRFRVAARPEALDGVIADMPNTEAKRAS